MEGGHVRGVVNDALYPVLEEFTRQYSGYKDRSIQRLISEEQELYEPVMKGPVPASLSQKRPGAFPIAA
jgi:hypothetical protein